MHNLSKSQQIIYHTNEINNNDHLNIMRSSNNQRFSKSFFMEDGKIKSNDFQNVKFFNHEKIYINDITDLFLKLKKIKNDKTTFILRGAVNENAPKTIRRLKAGRSDNQGYLFSIAHKWQCLDIDKLPNVNKLSDFNDIRSFIYSLLPIQFQNTTMIFEFSSSMFVMNKDRISCHLYFFTNEYIDESTTKSFHNLINNYVTKNLKNIGSKWEYVENGKTKFGKIDNKVSECVQPIYTALPEFINVENPIPDYERIYLNTKQCSEIDFKACWKALTIEDVQCMPVKAKAVQKALKRAINITQIKDTFKQNPVDDFKRIDFSKKIIIEIEKVLNHRMKFNKHYISNKGIIEGNRMNYMTILLSFVAESLKIEEIKNGKFEELCIFYAKKYTDNEFCSDFLNKENYKNIKERAYASANGEFIVFKGIKKDVRYGFSTDRTFKEFEISDREIEILNLRIIVSKELRHRFKVRELRGSKITKTGKIKTAKNSKILKKIETNTSIYREKLEEEKILKDKVFKKPTLSPARIKLYENRAKKLIDIINMKKDFIYNINYYVESYCVELSITQIEDILNFSRFKDSKDKIDLMRNKMIFLCKIEKLLRLINMEDHINPQLKQNIIIVKLDSLITSFKSTIKSKLIKVCEDLDFEEIKKEISNLYVYNPELAYEEIQNYKEVWTDQYENYHNRNYIVTSKIKALNDSIYNIQNK